MRRCCASWFAAAALLGCEPDAPPPSCIAYVAVLSAMSGAATCTGGRLSTSIQANTVLVSCTCPPFDAEAK